MLTGVISGGLVLQLLLIFRYVRARFNSVAGFQRTAHGPNRIKRRIAVPSHPVLPSWTLRRLFGRKIRNRL